MSLPGQLFMSFSIIHAWPTVATETIESFTKSTDFVIRTHQAYSFAPTWVALLESLCSSAYISYLEPEPHYHLLTAHPIPPTTFTLPRGNLSWQLLLRWTDFFLIFYFILFLNFCFIFLTSFLFFPLFFLGGGGDWGGVILRTVCLLRNKSSTPPIGVNQILIITTKPIS